MIRRLALWFCFALPAGVWAQQPGDLAEVPVSRAVAARSKIYFAMDTRALLEGYQANPRIVRPLVDAVVMAATGKPTIAAAWASLAKPGDTVGIKVAAAPGSMGGTHPEVVRAVAQGLQSAGIPPARIIVWDRNRDDLAAAGFSEHDPDFRLAWIDPTTGYDRQATLTAPVLGRLIWGDSKFGEKKGARLVDVLLNGDQLSSTSYFASVLSRRVTKVVNLPSLCDSYMCGLNGALANMTLWNVDNWRRFIREPNFGNPYLAEIYADPTIHDKVVLTVMDGLALQLAGGPFPNPNFTRQNYTIFASKDPVAIDATAIRLIDEYRRANKLPPIAPVAGHVETAASMGLGNSAEDAIDQVRVGSGSGGGFGSER
ncbi:MAG: DUF362 domain-containing protein [Terrimicrobiaceae bacterium]|nr:DUF362 domain-containing protein [Terrimicrobiaceae bacterium]